MTGEWMALLSTLTEERRRAMEFLHSHLPQSDLDCYGPELFLSFADHALTLRREAPWCKALEQEVFEHYVLFPRVNDEDLSFHRAVFYDALWPRVRELRDTAERVLEVNRWCHEMATYEMQDDRTASPLTVWRSGSGRCGEESAFLVAALRSVGIPARQVYVPRWAHCDDNHAWVEALCDGQWRFLGACEPEPILDRGWFNTPASRAILIHSRIFGEGASPVHGEPLGREGGVTWFNQTARYAPVRDFRFRVLGENGPAAGATLGIQLLNEAGFHTVATLIADENGESAVSLGLGDFRVWAAREGLYTEMDCPKQLQELQLMPPPQADTPWRERNFHAPKSTEVHPAVLDGEQKAARAAQLSRGTALREARMAGFGVRGLSSELCAAARGNASVIAAFLGADTNPLRETLLRALRSKDLRDISKEILDDHLDNAPDRGSLPEDVYNKYVLCPRIEWEPLTAYRAPLSQALTPAEQDRFRADPAALWAFLRERIHNCSERVYANLAWTPARAWKAGRCDERSRRLLYAAMLRTLGVPARLRPLDGMPQYWQDGAFRSILPEKTGMLQLTVPCGQGRTLSCWTGKGWRLLKLSMQDEDAWTLPAGLYRLVTSVRLPNGDQYAAQREIQILPGQTTVCSLPQLTFTPVQALTCQTLPAMPAVTPEGAALPDLVPRKGQASLLLWLEEGGEPTEHLLHELASRQRAWQGAPVEMILLLRGQDSLAHPSVAGFLREWNQSRVLFDDWYYDLEHVARCLTCDPDTPPLAVLCDGEGRAVYGFSGYRVGSAELLLKMAASIPGLAFSDKL